MHNVTQQSAADNDIVKYRIIFLKGDNAMLFEEIIAFYHLQQKYKSRKSI